MLPYQPILAKKHACLFEVPRLSDPHTLCWVFSKTNIVSNWLYGADNDVQEDENNIGPTRWALCVEVVDFRLQLGLESQELTAASV